MIAGGDGSHLPTAIELQGARYQGRKIAQTANKLHGSCPARPTSSESWSHAHEIQNFHTYGGECRRATDPVPASSAQSAIVDEEYRPWVFMLRPGNTADCVVADTCVSLIPGITELLADKGYDTDAFRVFLKEHRIKTVIPSKSNRKKRIQHKECHSACNLDAD